MRRGNLKQHRWHGLWTEGKGQPGTSSPARTKSAGPGQPGRRRGKPSWKSRSRSDPAPATKAEGVDARFDELQRHPENARGASLWRFRFALHAAAALRARTHCMQRGRFAHTGPITCAHFIPPFSRRTQEAGPSTPLRRMGHSAFTARDLKVLRFSISPDRPGLGR